MIVATLASVVTGACGLFPSFGEFQGGVPLDGSGGIAADASATDGANGEASVSDCPGTAPPAMVRVGSFCIDSTEVTAGQYKAFTNAMQSDLRNQPAICRWNTTLYPGTSSHPADWSIAPGFEDAPITLVNWCQAAAYCNWAGKRLCGHIGGGENPIANRNDPNASEWMWTCTRGGTRTYPYGDAVDQSACVTGRKKPDLVKSHPPCEGGYPGIFDMSGNLFEWEDSCTGTGQDDACLVRGGSWKSSASDARCEIGNYPQFRTLAADDIGFRCCAP